MNINTLTIGELKEIAELLSGTFEAKTQKAHPFIGKFVICRCFSAGVHAGELVSVNNDQVILRNSRRLWLWKAQAGVALSGVAQSGLSSGCKIDTENPEIALFGVIELIPCSQGAAEIIREYNNDR